MVRHLFLSFLLAYSLTCWRASASPCLPKPPRYCSRKEWQNDILLKFMLQVDWHPQDVCTPGLEFVVVDPGGMGEIFSYGSPKTLAGYSTKNTQISHEAAFTATNHNLTATTPANYNSAVATFTEHDPNFNTTKTSQDSDASTLANNLPQSASTIARTSSDDTKTTLGHKTPVLTGNVPEDTKTVYEAISTVTEYGPDVAVTEVVMGSETSILIPRTVIRTAAAFTTTLPTSFRTIDTTEVEYPEATTTRTITVGSTTKTVYENTRTESIATATTFDALPNAISTCVDVRITGTNVHTVVTGALVRYLLRETIVDKETHTVIITLDPAVANTVFDYTATEEEFPTRTVVTVNEPSATELLTIPTTTKTAYQAIATKFISVITSTKTDIVTSSTFTTHDLTTETITAVSTEATTVFTTTITQFPMAKRAPATTLTALVVVTGCPEDAWVDEFGEDHFHSACLCLPGRLAFKRAAATQMGRVYKRAVTLTLPFMATTTLFNTSTETLVIGDATTLPRSTLTRDVTPTVQLVPIADTTVTHVSIGDAREATTEVTFTDRETVYGVSTVFGQSDVTQSSDYVAVQTQNAATDQTQNVEETSTSYFTSIHKITVNLQHFYRPTMNQTVHDVLTRTTPVAVTDVQKHILTKTIFTDATTTLSVEPTSTVGVITTHTEYTILTVNDNSTSTITTTQKVVQTITDYAEATVTCRMPILNGGLETDEDVWRLSGNDQVDASIVSPGYTSDFLLMSDNMFRYRLLEVFQNMRTCGGVKFACDYNWLFSNYYETVINGTTYVPYVRFYFNNELVSNRFPVGPEEVGVWMDGSFEFTSSPNGRDRIWIDASSPQPRTGPGGGDNFLSVDNIRCSPVLG
ncbi:hypothetical protein AK830_g3263 [Neonectria ditissima]|uniref:PA14 domain-containing protein n=1 Tax=Neonectria ditissima TaxID=78410 RepID=A0A0N8H815_9HYPO|nr:hypothetical protein AK830_g3263 [Neonectria ditissima]